VKILQLLRVSICQASKAAQMHPQAQIQALHEGRGDVLRFVPSVDDLGYGLRDSRSSTSLQSCQTGRSHQTIYN